MLSTQMPSAIHSVIRRPIRWRSGFIMAMYLKSGEDSLSVVT